MRQATRSYPLRYWLLALAPALALLLGFLWVGPAVAAPEAPTPIPLGKAPVLDANCTTSAGEYGDAAVFPFTDAFGVPGTVYLKHDRTNLYVCMEGASSANSTAGPFASLYLDTDNGREQYAQNEDIGLRATLVMDATVLDEAVRGTGSGNYVADPTILGWNAQASSGLVDQAEWRVPLVLVSKDLCRPFGVAVYHHWMKEIGDDYGWPSNQYYDSPQTWQEMELANLCEGKIAYVYRLDQPTATDFQNLLESRGFTVQLVPLATVLATDFSVFDLVVIADDSGVLDNWPPATPGPSPQANWIAAAERPVLGLGEGGYAYFGKHASPLGWPNAWHTWAESVHPSNTGLTYWHVPSDFGVPPPDPLKLYTGPVNEVGVHLPSVAGVIDFARELVDREHAPLLAERGQCRQLWGFSGGPAAMTAAGADLFVNAVFYALGQQCEQQQQPPPDCVAVTKEADPTAGTPLGPNAVIRYTLKYTVRNDPLCTLQRAVLEDRVPEYTLFVPNSAGAGTVPGADGVVQWNLGPLAPGAAGEKSFAVSVTDAACNQLKAIDNAARLVTSLGIFTSNVVTHPLGCPPVVPMGTQPPYAEDEIQIYPYPLVTGRLTEMSVRLRNLSAVPRTVTVTFETSSGAFGIGIPFGALPVAGNPRSVTLPAWGMVEVKLDWVPVVSGHYCIRVKIEGAGFVPIYTYRNLDVAEDLRPGVTDVLTFVVANPTAGVATIDLVVDNTCPGWAAAVDPPSLANMAPGEVRTATLAVTPPVSGTLGTTCHIDVQGWIGTTLIGGIRKLDIPPVHLPEANPSYMEREISLRPDPPLVNQPTELCAELRNPLPVARVVSLDFAWAAFGAGIGFTPLASLNNVTLPPNSIDRTCVTWIPTPVSGGSLHRCILLTLRQAGFADQTSQRNVDLRLLRLRSLEELSTLGIPFSIGNTRNYTVPLRISISLIGIGPILIPDILPDPPPELGPGQQMTFTLKFVPPAASAEAGHTDSFDELPQYGDTTRAEVTLVLDGEEAGGFAVEFITGPRLHLPYIHRQ